MASAWEISWRGDLSIAIHETSGNIFNYFHGRDSYSFVPKGGNFYLEVAGFEDKNWQVTIHPIERQDFEQNSAVGGDDEVVARQPSGGEESEQQLIKLIGEYATRYNNAPNDMAQGALRPERAHALCGLLTDRTVRLDRYRRNIVFD